MEGFKIELEVSLRDTRNFQEFIKDQNIQNIFDFQIEQTYSNSWVLTSEENLRDYEIQDLINELEEIFEGFEVDIVAEY